MIRFDAHLDLYPLLAATLAALSCGLLGNFLLLRRQSLMGDAISHSVLPGLVGAFLLFQSRGSMVMLLGACVAGIVTVLLIEAVKRFGRVEPGAAMGVVFSMLFALGVLLIEQASARQIDLDAECVLHGQLETLALHQHIPRAVWTLLATLGVVLAFITLLFKELRLASFDPGLATALGFRASWMHVALMLVVALATVASFEAVGSILVIAMLIVPAATARLLTQRLLPQILTSAGVALLAAIMGYFGASALPAIFEMDSVNAAGSITVALGLFLLLAIIISPSQGLLASRIRSASLSRSIALDNLLASLYRSLERQQSPSSNVAPRSVLRAAIARGLVHASSGALTPQGLARAQEIIRRHRAWESYLVDESVATPDHVHDLAEQLEHIQPMPDINATLDPHGKKIPRDTLREEGSTESR